PPVYVVVTYVAALAGWNVRGPVGAALAGLAAAAFLYSAAFLYGAARVGIRRPEQVALAATVVCAVALVLRRDLHGAALVAGVLAGVVTSVTAWVPRWRPAIRSGRPDRR